jgi:N utilization substance protein B
MIRSRRSARELVLKALYAIELTGRSSTEVINDALVVGKARGPLLEFSRRLFEETLSHCDELDSHIRSKATNWDFERLALLDKQALRIAVCEFLFFEDIPPKVTIDEAIEISRKYSTDKSDKFVNGVLDAVLSDLRRENKIVKKGRGLLEESPSSVSK